VKWVHLLYSISINFQLKEKKGRSKISESQKDDENEHLRIFHKKIHTKLEVSTAMTVRITSVWTLS
jgi:hypothetical protein